MKRFLLAFVLLAAVAGADESYTLNANATQQADLTSIVDGANFRTCKRLNAGSAPTWACTQAQACTAAGAAGGASCTAGQARTANARIFPQTTAGREEFLTFQIALPAFKEMKDALVGIAQDRQCEFWATANQTQRDAVCTASGLSAGCVLCK